MPSWDVSSVLEYRLFSARLQETLSAPVYSNMDNPAHVVLHVLLPQRLKNSNGWSTLFVLHHFCDLRNAAVTFNTQCHIWRIDIFLTTSSRRINAE